MKNLKTLLTRLSTKKSFFKVELPNKGCPICEAKISFIIKSTSLLPRLMFDKAHLLFWVVASRLSFYKMAATHYDTSTSGSLNSFMVCTGKEHAMLDLPEAMLFRLTVCSGRRALGDLSTHYPITVF